MEACLTIPKGRWAVTGSGTSVSPASLTTLPAAILRSGAPLPPGAGGGGGSRGLADRDEGLRLWDGHERIAATKAWRGPAGVDRRHAGEPERASRLSGRLARERSDLATGDGAFGFRTALDEMSISFPPSALHHAQDRQRDSPDAQVRPARCQVWPRNPERAEQGPAGAAVAMLAERRSVKHEKAVTCLLKERDALPAFHDFPAGHGANCARPP